MVSFCPNEFILDDFTRPHIFRQTEKVPISEHRVLSTDKSGMTGLRLVFIPV
jgi:hypothetical protein